MDGTRGMSSVSHCVPDVSRCASAVHVDYTPDVSSCVPDVYRTVDCTLDTDWCILDHILDVHWTVNWSGKKLKYSVMFSGTSWAHIL